MSPLFFFCLALASAIIASFGVTYALLGKLQRAHDRLDAVALPGSAEAWRLEAERAQMAALLANKLASDKDRKIAELLDRKRQDGAKIYRLSIRVEQLERQQLVERVFPRLAMQSGRA